MSKRILVVQVATFVLCLSVVMTPVLAANSQGLTWSVQVGDRYDYLISSQRQYSSAPENITENQNTEHRVYLVVEDVPELPPTVSNMSELLLLQHFNRSSYYENGTPFSGGFDFIWFVLPIGNWSLITDMFMEHLPSTEGVDLVDTGTLWGYTFTRVYSDSTHVYSELYLKSTGALYKYLTSYSYAGDSYSLLTRTEITSLSGVPPDIDSLLVLGIGAVAVVGIVGVLTFVRRRR